MHRNKFSIIFILISTLVLFGVSIIYFFIQSDLTYKGNFIRVAFPSPTSDGSFVEDVKKSRKYETLNLNTDSIHNELVISEFHKKLNNIKIVGDSINGIDIQFSDNTPYKYYLQVIQICNEKKPKLFLPYLNHIYALGKSKFQLIQDSINLEKSILEHVATQEITGQTY